MKKFFAFIIRQSVAIVLIVLFVLALGIYSTMQMPINLLPDINIPMVCVQVIYVGANAQSAESDVTEPLEEGLSAISGVTSIDSYSYDNLSAVVLSFDYGTDTSAKKTDIQSKLSSIDLPSDVITSVYDIDLNSEALATLSVTSEQGDTDQDKLENAYLAAQDLSSKIAGIDGVESVSIKGGADYSYLIQPYGGLELISPLIVEAFSYGAYDLPLGSVTEVDEDGNSSSVQVRNTSDIASEKDIYNVPVTLPSSMVTLLSSVKSQIADGLATIYDQIDAKLQASSMVLRLLGFTYPDDIEAILENETINATIHSTLQENGADLPDEILHYIMVEADPEDILAAASDEMLLDILYNDTVYSLIQSALADLDMSLSDELLEFIMLTDFGQATSDGLTVHVSDIATITPEETFSSYVYYSDGEISLIHGTLVEIYKSNGANSSAVVESVKDIFEDYAAGDGAAYGAKIQLLDDQSEFISTSITNVLVSMIIGGVLAVIVIFLFLKKVRISLIIAVTMPLSVLAALICLFLMGITLNMVSLGGLAVGIGMLVDNSIVVIESITMHREKGKNAYRAAVDGTTEVGGALFGSTLTTICVFIPIIFTGGLTAEIFVDLSWAVIFSLAFSLIVAVTVIPGLYVLFSGQRRTLLNGGKPARDLALAGNTPYDTAPAATAEEEGIYADTSYAGSSTDEVHAAAAAAAAGIAGPGATGAAGGAGALVPAAGIAAPGAATILADASAGAEGAAAGGAGADGGDSGSGSGDGGKNKDSGNGGKKPNRFIQWFRNPRIMRGVTGFYSRILPAVLSHKLITILLAIVIFGASIGLLFLTGMEFLPSIDKGQIEVNMSYSATTQLDEKQEDVFAFADIINNNIDNIDYVSVNIGKNGLLALTDTGIITVQLTTNRGTSKIVSQIRELAQDSKASGAITGTVTVKEVDGVVASLTSGMSDLSVTIEGADGDTLKEIAGKIETELWANGFEDVTDSAADNSREYNLTFDRYKMESMGLDYSTLILTLRIGIASYTACSVTLGGSSYDVDVQFADGAVTDQDTLLDFIVGYTPVTDESGNTVSVKAIKLSEILAEDGFTIVDTPACIRRSNGQEMISVSASKNSTDTGSASTEMQSIAKKIIKDYDGYEFEVSGIASYLTDAFSGLIVALIVSLFLLYAVMAVQFASAIKPLIIMASIPFSFTGGFIFLVITGTSLNVVSFVGLIMLMGVVVNNAIVMLEKIKQLHDGGMQHYYAVQEACKTRLRPILMTTLTTILALIPIAIGVGQGSELMQPLGIVVIGGLLIGTLVTLVLIPTIYSAVHRLSKQYPEGKKAAKLAAKAAAAAAAAAAAEGTVSEGTAAESTTAAETATTAATAVTAETATTVATAVTEETATTSATAAAETAECQAEGIAAGSAAGSADNITDGENGTAPEDGKEE